MYVYSLPVLLIDLFLYSLFDLINVHLFHDASNLLAAERSPSIYSKCRRNALKFTLESLPLDSTGKHVPYVIFGDFNFRLDAHRLVEVRREREGERLNGCLISISQPNDWI